MNKNNIESIYPLSPTQEGMLFHTLYAPESGVYFQQLSCGLRGAVNVPALQEAWQRVADRHPVLRTSFVWGRREKSLQVVRPHLKLSWNRQDLRGLPVAVQQAHLDAFHRAERARGFELTKAPLMRLALIRLTDDSYQFVWSYHHLILDGWSASMLIQEVFTFYDAFNRGDDPYLVRPRPYRDYIAWLKQQDLTQAEAFWRRLLAGVTAPTAFGVERAAEGAATEDDEVSQQQVRLSAEVTARLQHLARQHKLTLSVVVQGAWALLLSRYSGDERVVFGLTVSGRPTTLQGAESMLGVFINTLPVGIDVPDHESPASWLTELQRQHAERQQFESSPLVQVQGWSDVPRGLPLFNSILVFENYPVDASLQGRAAQEGLQDLSVHVEHADERTNYPLTVLVLPGRELCIELRYERRHFHDEAITRMLLHLQNLLEGFAAAPQQKLADVEMLSEDERRQLFVEWNNTKTEEGEEGVVELFETHARRTPDSVAVGCAGLTLTYAELDRLSTRVARRLARRGAAPERVVAVLAERGAG
ncbi:MAG TPA: condensation domain-containing protein, partial [Pyrinomonadaceae bacterium]|nr:condensation domain-containing protein [Pyrinomonadaceae bacterium]